MQDVMSVDGNRVPARFTQRQIGDSKGGTVAVAAVCNNCIPWSSGIAVGAKERKKAFNNSCGQSLQCIC
jgi:hypothetical protein